MNSTKVLKSLRGKRLLTQDDMAAKINVSRQAYCTYENNLIQCELDLVFKILSVLNVNHIELLDFLNALKQDFMSYNKNKSKGEEYVY